MYSTYLKVCQKNYISHNNDVNNADIPKRFKKDLILDLNELLTEEEFKSKIKTNNKFAKLWGIEH